MAQGKHEGTGGGTRRGLVIAGVVLLVLLAGAVGYLVARAGDNSTASPSPGVSTSPTRSATSSPTGSGTPTPSESPAPSASATPSPSGDDLATGRNFVFAKAAGVADPRTLTLDLAYFYTGQDATDQAAAHDDESPPPNGYYIVNDNPRLRTVPVSDAVVVRYIPEGACCNLKSGTWDGFAAAVNRTTMTDYPNRYAPWWVTVQDGQIVRVTQQYLP